MISLSEQEFYRIFNRIDYCLSMIKVSHDKFFVAQLEEAIDELKGRCSVFIYPPCVEPEEDINIPLLPRFFNDP